jgi:hypothetical protein
VSPGVIVTVHEQLLVLQPSDAVAVSTTVTPTAGGCVSNDAANAFGSVKVVAGMSLRVKIQRTSAAQLSVAVGSDGM